MTRRSAQDRIFDAEENLARAVALLLRMGPGVTECSTILDQTAESIKCIQEQHGIAADLKPSIERLQQKTVLVQHLLSSAVTFYCGWLSAGAARTEDYLPLPSNDRATGRGALNIEG